MTAPDFEATADAFGMLADPVRVEILVALWDLDASSAQYSDLRDAVGMADSGRFNYHLSKLTDHFVEKTAEGYRPRPSGLVVLNAIYAGSYVDAPTRDSLDVEGTCPACGDDLVGEYDAGMFRVTCGGCGEQMFMLSFPPGGVRQRDDEALVRAVSQHARAHVRRTSSGLCPFCGGSMALSLDLDVDTGLPASVLLRADCANCGVTNRASVGFSVLEHPAVAGFLHEHGVPEDAPPWRFEWCLRDDAITVVSRDPPRVRVHVTAAGAEDDGGEHGRTENGGVPALDVTVDEHGRVVETERVNSA